MDIIQHLWFLEHIEGTKKLHKLVSLAPILLIVLFPRAAESCRAGLDRSACSISKSSSQYKIWAKAVYEVRACNKLFN